MDSALKERLVGAAVLVALGVWLIPWVLDGRKPAPADAPPDEAREDTVALPVEDAPARTQTRTIALTDHAETPAAGDPKSAAPAPKANSPATGQAAAVPPPETDQSPTATATPATTAADEAPTVAPSPPPETAPAAAQPASVEGGWYVQLGSFGEIGNANRLASRVSTFGYTADVSAYRSGARTLNRVRVGPAPSREEAEAIASSLSAHGFVAQVVSAD